jgi:DNA-binding NarL/FixJ family response regulator
MGARAKTVPALREIRESGASTTASATVVCETALVVRSCFRVLVVDDHAQYRHAITGLLSLFDELDVVAEAETVADALIALSNNEIDVVLLDVHMPVTDGITGARVMLDRYPNLRVMLCSTADRAELRAFETNDRLVFVSKADLEPDHLIRWCRSWGL